MQNTRKVTNDIIWVGCNDRRLAMFENIFPLQNGVSYNSYLVMDEKITLFDTMDSNATESSRLPCESAHGTRSLCKYWKTSSQIS